MADCGIGIVGVVSGGITVLCRDIHTTAHGKGDAFCLVVTCGQGEITGRPAVKHLVLGHCGLVQRHGHLCAVRYRVGLFAGGCVNVAVQLAGHIAAVVFHSNSAAGHGQLVAVQSIGVELPTGIEGDVLRNCGFFHIKLAIFGLAIWGGVPADEIVTRTGGMIDGIQIGFLQIVCQGLSDFFGLINRHLIVGQVAALGIKGHMAEAKKLVSVLYSIPQVIIIFKQILCVVLVVVVVDDTCRTIIQTGFESSQFSREYNVFQTGAIGKGPIKGRCTTVPGFNYFYFFRDGDIAQAGASKKGTPADRLNILT